MHNFKEEALEYHRQHPKGKTEVVPTKPTQNAHDLSLAYSPGVAFPCLEIKKNPELVYEYTNKGNLLAIITNGTAILGLGDIGPAAGKPVMEGKAVLFKKFAHIDVFDLELNTHDSEQFIQAVKLMEPSFGGINLEDIKAPECFYIEEQLQKKMNIPVFHDDQHGTAIISTAALINTLHLSGKNAAKLKVVFSGAGAAAIAISKLILNIGILPENIYLVDSRGVINQNRNDLNEVKKQFVRQTQANTLAEIIKDADVFIGVSQAGVLSPEMLLSMAPAPVILALANPDPEIPYDVARKARPDAFIGTGRSDYPNQVNNVLGFPYIFRGALDMRADRITLEMKLAAARALAELARQEVPAEVAQAYEGQHFEFGLDYFIPKPFDPRLYFEVSNAVAEAADLSGAAQIKYPGKLAYFEHLKKIKSRYSP